MNQEPPPIINYPCAWLYKVLGADRQRLEGAIATVVRNEPCLVSPSNSSSSGKYHCLNLEIQVTDACHRDRLYAELKKHPAVIMVL